jgi:predicted helicase
LAEVIKTIAPRIKDFAPSLWSSYIERDLIPRVHGFELLMASYAMCHLKLEMILRELGYRPTSSAPRQSVYLTNSLEEGAPPNYELPFMNWLADEAKLANTIKNDMPIMCVVGNPPYLGESSKASPWLEKLMEDYKKEPGGTEKLKEKNSKWLNDMYVKFMRMSSSLIEKNEEGILGFISNHGYLDNPTFRGMRWHLLKTFEKIWILDLHGNAKRKEAAPNGVSDKNVFDIMQGVAIIIAVKKKENTNELAEVYKGDLWGSRASKYSALDQCTLSSEIFKKIDTKPPLYQFLQQDWSTYESYEKGVSLNEFMPLHGNGIVTKRDGLNIHKNADGVRKVVQDFIRLSEQDLRTKYKLKPDVRDWRYEWAKKDIEENISNIPIQKVGYRIFDQRFMFYSGRSRGLVGWPVADVMSHYIRGDNIGLLTTKAHKDKEFAHAFVTDLPSEAIYFSATTGSNAMNFPLYVYPEGEGERQVNFDTDLYSQLRKIAADGENNTPDELDTFDYIYGVLYCPKYRSSFDEFLKSNFPKIPWPANANEFWAVSR